MRSFSLRIDRYGICLQIPFFLDLWIEYLRKCKRRLGAQTFNMCHFEKIISMLVIGTQNMEQVQTYRVESIDLNMLLDLNMFNAL